MLQQICLHLTAAQSQAQVILQREVGRGQSSLLLRLVVVEDVLKRADLCSGQKFHALPTSRVCLKS